MMNGNILMAMLRSRNPKAYEQIKAMKENGQDPVRWLKEQYRNGKISKSQLLQIKKHASMFGVNITDEQIREVTGEGETPPRKTDTGWF